MSTGKLDRRWRGLCEVVRLSKEHGRRTVRIHKPPQSLLDRLEAEGVDWSTDTADGRYVTLSFPDERTLEPFPEDAGEPA